eukprot:5246175-Heterocapsa_arctica.AAC.1
MVYGPRQSLLKGPSPRARHPRYGHNLGSLYYDERLIARVARPPRVPPSPPPVPMDRLRVPGNTKNNNTKTTKK